MIELEKTYLLKEIPPGLFECKSKEVIDLYIPSISPHPTLRLRKNGDKYEITKKEPIEGDREKQNEDTIPLTKDEYEAIFNSPGKKVSKIRYYYPLGKNTGEVDVFKESLDGLILADFEFTFEEEKSNFAMPPWCLADVTKETFIAGGMLCGKSYKDIEVDLNKFGYKKLSV